MDNKDDKYMYYIDNNNHIMPFDFCKLDLMIASHSEIYYIDNPKLAPAEFILVPDGEYTLIDNISDDDRKITIKNGKIYI